MNKLGFGYLRLPQFGNAEEKQYDWTLLNEMTDRFLACGGDYFDTAYTYLDGISEQAVRDCIVRRHPRGSFRIADKIPGYLCKTPADTERLFLEMLERCGTDYLDVLMLHWLNRKHFRIAEQLDQFGFLQKMKDEGKARRIGFSYHDSAELLDEILTKHPEVDVVQLQINYLDWETAGIQSRKCYEVCCQHGKPVIVMEPVKGGTLAALPEEAAALLADLHPDWTPASWAMRFVQSLPNVEVCLSGMNTMAQLEDNLQDIAPLNDTELDALQQVRTIIEAQTAVACTGCRYCVSHCPIQIRIPDYFKMYNELCRYPHEKWKIRPAYVQAATGYSKASDCLACGSCESHCPQQLPISALMQKVAEKLG